MKKKVLISLIKFNLNYSVNSDGVVTNIKKDKPLTPLKNSQGKYFVKIPYEDRGAKGYKQVLIHKLVADYFIPNPKGYRYIKFKDGDFSNYKSNNLRWSNGVK